MTFILSFIASGIGFGGCLYAAASLAMLIRREWSDAAVGLALSAIPLGIYAVAWHFLPMENWLILPGIVASIASTLTFVLVLKNGV